jgi:hypothetical protein
MDDKWGFINLQGELVIPCVYDDAKHFNVGYTRVKEGETYKVINKDGKVIIPQCSVRTYWSVVK